MIQEESDIYISRIRNSSRVLPSGQNPVDVLVG